MESDLTPAALTALRKIIDAADLDNRKMAAATGLTPSQGLVLRQICGHESITPGAVATALRFGQATITNIVDRLVAGGLVTRTRSLTDKRQMLLQATDEGREKLRASPFPLQLRFSQGFGALERWEQAMMLAALERLDALLTPGRGEETSPPAR
ncbi:DNA-binding MarR family transcriptional regulator [Novosphingobium sp. PhB55]|uniref:MarR family winged helix-turn-helix transcriptional regulator n=1 Tax=unclassified Novosphingobium TaxID=2644732 RepID=UPI0010648B97|nr:MarR family transcriptional regulator [Novosphingobium sp. PhB55]TDW60321.1 DNA-binding MarR family transcriptional regulator [Novosphingobium sp. PhB55]